MSKQLDNNQAPSSFRSFFTIPDNPSFISPPRRLLFKSYIFQMIIMFILSLLSFGVMWGFTITTFAFIFFRHHSLSKLWKVYGYSRLLFWLVTIILLILFMVICAFVRAAVYEWILERWHL